MIYKVLEWLIIWFVFSLSQMCSYYCFEGKSWRNWPSSSTSGYNNFRMDGVLSIIREHVKYSFVCSWQVVGKLNLSSGFWFVSTWITVTFACANLQFTFGTCFIKKNNSEGLDDISWYFTYHIYVFVVLFLLRYSFMVSRQLSINKSLGTSSSFIFQHDAQSVNAFLFQNLWLSYTG